MGFSIEVGFPGGSDGKQSAGNVGDPGSTLRWVRLQYSCLDNYLDRGAWWATVHGVPKSWTQLKHLSTHEIMHSLVPAILVSLWLEDENTLTGTKVPQIQALKKYMKTPR